MMVEATPAVVYFMATSDSDTPIKGPKMAPVVVSIIAGLFFIPICRLSHCFFANISTMKQREAARMRIILALNAG